MSQRKLAELESDFLLDTGTLEAVAGGYYSAPFEVLGMHAATVRGQQALAIRTFQPQAASVSVVRNGTATGMRRVHPDGLFESILPGETEFFPYRLDIVLPDGGRYEIDDPYRYP